MAHKVFRKGSSKWSLPIAISSQWGKMSRGIPCDRQSIGFDRAPASTFGRSIYMRWASRKWGTNKIQNWRVRYYRSHMSIILWPHPTPTPHLKTFTYLFGWNARCVWTAWTYVTWNLWDGQEMVRCVKSLSEAYHGAAIPLPLDWPALIHIFWELVKLSLRRVLT